MTALVNLLDSIKTEISGISYDEIKIGEGWVATRIKVDGFNPSMPGQYVQISIGGEIVGIYLESARGVLDDSILQGKDLMLKTILSGEIHAELNNQIMRYALNNWHGVPWDEASGFAQEIN